MNLISLYKDRKERKKEKMKECCGIRYTVKVAKDTHRERKKKKFRVLKTRAQITYHLTVVNQIKKKNIFNEIVDTDIFRESIQKKEMQTHTLNFIEKKNFTKKSRKKERFNFKRNPFDLIVMYS